MAAKKAKETFNFPLKWSVPEYEYFEKSSEWFWAVLVVTFAAATAAFIFGSFLFGVLIFVSGIALALHGIKKPHLTDFSIMNRGVAINNKFYPYSALDSFWIKFDPPFTKILSLKSKKTFMPYIAIPLGDLDPNFVRETMIKFIREKEHDESFIDFLIKVLRF